MLYEDWGLRILFLSFYYVPDLCPGSFRIVALIKATWPLLPEGAHIDVVTTMPNSYCTISAAAAEYEESDGISIRRIVLPSHKSGMLDQSKALIAYARGVRAAVTAKQYDLVFAASSRLMTAVLGAYVARGKKAPLYLDIRDIFVDTIRDVLPRWMSGPIEVAFSFLERYAISTTRKVNLVLHGFERYFAKRYPKQHYYFYPNGIDDAFIVPLSTQATSSEGGSPPYHVLYAGNTGEGQGLHRIIPELARAMRGQMRFTLIGDGGRKEQLKAALNKAGVDNVTVLDPVNRPSLVSAHHEADVLFLHLNNYGAFRRCCLPNCLSLQQLANRYRRRLRGTQPISLRRRSKTLVSSRPAPSRQLFKFSQRCRCRLRLAPILFTSISGTISCNRWPQT